MVNFCMLGGGCRDWFLMLHFGQTKVWDENDRDAARSFRLLHFFFAASCLSSSNYNWLFSLCTSCLGLRSRAAMTD